MKDALLWDAIRTPGGRYGGARSWGRAGVGGALAVADRLNRAAPEGRAQPRTGYLVALHAFHELDQVAPAALRAARGAETFVLQHASAQGELLGRAVTEIGKDDDRVAPLRDELAQFRKARPSGLGHQ